MNGTAGDGTVAGMAAMARLRRAMALATMLTGIGVSILAMLPSVPMPAADGRFVVA